MEEKQQHLENEISDLKQALESFEKEKERVRAIIGGIGGVPRFRTKLVNAVFVAVIVISVAVSIVAGDKWRLLMIEVTTVALSVKIIYLIHCMMRVNHFKFWILSAIEWRINEMMSHMKQPGQ
jgi:hypothetical protein